MTPFIVEPERCSRDGICQAVCPKALIAIGADGLPFLPEDKASRCNLCGQCVAFCPEDAVSLASFAGQTVEALDPALVVGPAQALQFLKGRRSVRTFTEAPVPTATIQALLAAARMAPSGGNNQIVEWIVVERPGAVGEIARLIAEWFDTACRTDPVLSKRYAIDSILARFRAGTDVILRGAPHLVAAVTPAKAVWGAVDSAIALTTFNLAADAHGVGCCWAGYFIRAAAASEALRTHLGVGPDMAVQGAMVFGNAKYRSYRVPCRNKQVVRWM